MIFTYTCPKCNNEFLVKKDKTQSSEPEMCPECKVQMKRKWTTSFQGPNTDQAFQTMTNRLRHSKPTGDRQIFF